MGLLLHPADDHPGLAKVALGMARGMGQRHEHLLGPAAAALPYVILDDRVLVPKPVLVAQPLEDALGRVALLPGDLVVFFKDAVDDAGVGLQLGPSGRCLPPVAWGAE